MKFHTFFCWVHPTLKTFDLGLKLPFYLIWKVSGGGWVGGLGLWYQPKSKSLDFDFWYGLGLRLRLDNFTLGRGVRIYTFFLLVLIHANNFFFDPNICQFMSEKKTISRFHTFQGVEGLNKKCKIPHFFFNWEPPLEVIIIWAQMSCRILASACCTYTKLLKSTFEFF